MKESFGYPEKPTEKPGKEPSKEIHKEESKSLRESVFRSGPQGLPTASRAKEIKSGSETPDESRKREIYALLSILSEDVLTRMAEYLQTPEGLLREKQKFVKNHSALRVTEAGTLEFAGTLDGGEYTSEDIVRDFAGIESIFSRVAKKELKKGEEAFSSEQAKRAYQRMGDLGRSGDLFYPLPHRGTPEAFIRAGIDTAGGQAWSLLLALPKIFQRHFHRLPTSQEFSSVAQSAEKILIQLSSMHVFQSMHFADVSTKSGKQVSADIDEALLPNVFNWFERIKIHQDGDQAHLDWNDNFLKDAMQKFESEDDSFKDFLSREPRQGCPARDVRVTIDDRQKSGVVTALHILLPIAEEVVLPNQELYWRSVKDMVETARQGGK